jgi:hypothetical protein
MLKRLWGVTLLLVLASNLCWAQYRFNGTFYQLRWGQTEGSQDLITPVNALGNPLCVKMGTSWSAYLDGGGNLLGWKVGYARLRSLVDDTVYFTVNDPGVGNLKPPGQPYPLPDLPAHLDHAQLDVAYVIYYWGAWGPTYYLTPIYSSEVFIVLDAPKAPMNPAWVSMLRESCRWASKKINLFDAARAVTFGVFYRKPGFYYPDDSDSRWVPDGSFRLKALLDKWTAMEWTRGNCVDVSFFTMIALCSLGMDFSARRLVTASLLPPSPGCGRESHPENPWHCSNSSSLHFHTNMVCPIGSDPTPGDDPSEPIPPYPDYTYKWYSWAWHQVCVLSGVPDTGAGIWDPTAAQKIDLFGSSYRNPPADHPACWWIQEDYWQMPRMWAAPRGLVSEPEQIDGAEPVVEWTGKCGVSTLPWTPP